MAHTVHLIDSGVVHRLEHVPDEVAQGIWNWWAPSDDATAVVPEYFRKVLKDEAGRVTRAVCLRRGGISALDIVAEEQEEPDAPQQPSPAEQPEAPPSPPLPLEAPAPPEKAPAAKKSTPTPPKGKA